MGHNKIKTHNQLRQPRPDGAGPHFVRPLRKALGFKMTDNELSKIINGNSINVHIVNPPIENPWRTQGDYQQEQEEARERHEMLQEQHRAIIRSHWAAIFAAAAAITTAIATCALVYITAQSQTQLVEHTKSLQPPKVMENSKYPPK